MTETLTRVQPIILPYRGKSPKFGTGAYAAPGVCLIGDVTLGDQANVWFGSVIRGDDEPIVIGARTNIQDGCVIHVFGGKFATTIGADVTVGHGARLHGCTIEDLAMIGIGAVVLDGAVIETGAIVAAGAVVAPGKRVKRGEMWAGCPAKLARAVRPEEMETIIENARHYVERAAEFRASGS